MKTTSRINPKGERSKSKSEIQEQKEWKQIIPNSHSFSQIVLIKKYKN